MRTQEQFPKPTEAPGKWTFKSNNTKFTLCVYWERKSDGTFWTVREIQEKMHRKYIDSYDYHLTTGYQSVTRHDEAYWTLLTWIQKHIHKAFKALIYMNDFLDQKQYLLAKLSPDVNACQLVFPAFTDPEADFTGKGQVYVCGINGEAIAESELQQRLLEKKPTNINDLLKKAA